MEKLKSVGKNLISTPIGTIGGGLTFLFLAKKYAKIQNKIGLTFIVLAGALVGSGVEYKLRAKFSKPTITPVK